MLCDAAGNCRGARQGRSLLDHRRRSTRAEAAPVFLSTPFPHLRHLAQMDRSGLHALGLHSVLTLFASPRAFRPCRPTVFDATDAKPAPRVSEMPPRCGRLANFAVGTFERCRLASRVVWTRHAHELVVSTSAAIQFRPSLDLPNPLQVPGGAGQFDGLLGSGGAFTESTGGAIRGSQDVEIPNR